MPEAVRSLKLDHIGVQVRDLDAAIEAFSRFFGYRQATEPVVNTRHRVRVVFMERPGSLPIKLFSPLDGAGSAGAKLHHLGFYTDDLERSLETLTDLGARVLSPPAPGEAFDDEPIAFCFAGGLNVEIITTDKRRNRIPPQ
jgi:methylmalonyl-CoA/ethylmalonyl-CoA epimerase